MMLKEVTTEKIKKKEEVNDAQKSYMEWRKKQFMIELLNIK